MLSDFDRKRKAEKEAARDEEREARPATEGEGSADPDDTQQLSEAASPTWRRDPAGENSPLGKSAGASGMAPQTTDQPDPEREAFRDRT